MRNNEEHFPLTEYSDVIREVLDSGGEFRIYPRGVSMLPLIREGKDSVVLIKPAGRLKKGDIAFYRRDNGSFVLHRVISARGDSYTMCGDNQLAPEKGVKESSVIGVAARVYRGEKQPSAFLYALYRLIWRSFFLRRVYFRLKKLF